MVMVEPPPGWQPPPAGPLPTAPNPPNRSPQTRWAYDTPASDSQDLSETAPVDNPYEAAAAMSDTTPPDSDGGSSPNLRTAGPKRPPLPRRAPTPAAAETFANGEPLLPNADWMSPAARQRQRWLLGAGLAAGGLIVVCGLVAFVGYQSNGTRATETARTPEVGEPTTLDQSSNGSPPPVALTADSSPAEKSVATATDSITTPADTAADSPVTPSPAPIQPPPVDDTPPGLVAKDDVPKRGPAAVGTSSLLDELNGFSEYFDTTPAGTSGPGDEVPSEIASLPRELPVDDRRMPRPEPRIVDVATRLADPVSAVQFSGTPLIDFLRFVSDMSTIPITLDPDALRRPTVTAMSPVEFKLTDTTVGGMLQAALAPYELSFVAIDEQLLVTRTGPADGRLRENRYDVSDLAADEAQLATLSESLIALVARESWEEAGSEGVVEPQDMSLVVRQTEPVHFQVAVFFDKLRTARKLRPRGGFDPAAYSLDTRIAQAAEKLAAPISLNFGQPTRFVQILDRLGKLTGMAILVDWRAAAEIDWNPDAETTLSVDKVPLSETLTKLLEPMDLTYRIVDSSTLQITTPQALAVEVEFYPCADLLMGDDAGARLVERLKSSLGDPEFTAGESVIEFDLAGGCLIAALRQPGQVALAKLLAGWRVR